MMVLFYGGITYREHEKGRSVYGFDTKHCDSNEYPINDKKWIKEQIKIMLKGILLAKKLEVDYLLAEGDNKKRAKICQKLADLQPKQYKNFGMMINVLCGKL